MAAANRTDLPGGTTPAVGMTWIPDGEFAMGSEDFYPEERPCTASRSTASGSTSIR